MSVVRVDHRGSPRKQPAGAGAGVDGNRSGFLRWLRWLIPAVAFLQIVAQFVSRNPCLRRYEYYDGDVVDRAVIAAAAVAAIEAIGDGPLRGGGGGEDRPPLLPPREDRSPSSEDAVDNEDDDPEESSTSSSSSCEAEYDRMTEGRLPGLTEEDLRRSRTFVGNRRRLAKLVRKLKSSREGGDPARVVLAGGSITVGHGVRPPRQWTRRLEAYLNERFPIVAAEDDGDERSRTRRRRLKERQPRKKKTSTTTTRVSRKHAAEMIGKKKTTTTTRVSRKHAAEMIGKKNPTPGNEEEPNGDDESADEAKKDDGDDDTEREGSSSNDEDEDEDEDEEESEDENEDEDEDEDESEDEEESEDEDEDEDPESRGRRRRHSVVNVGTHGADICTLAKRANQVIEDLGPDVDLFVLEFAVNDYQGQDHVLQVEDRMDTFFEGFLDIATCTEAVLVKLLESYPDAAVIFLEMRTAVIPRKSGAVLHMGAAQHYQVPVLSYEQAMFPGYLRVMEATRDHHYTRPINDTIFPFPHGCHECDVDGMAGFVECQSVCDFMRWTEDWATINCTHPPAGREPCYVPFLAHDEVHPSGIGHGIMTDLIVDLLATTGLDLCRQEEEKKKKRLRSPDGDDDDEGEPTLLEEPAVMPRVGWMTPDPALLHAQTNFLWVNDTYLMFQRQDDLVPSHHTEGFEFIEDKFDRWGWIATNPEGNETIKFEINLEEGCYIPHLSVLKSYENMGKMTVTVYDRIRKRARTTAIDGQWKPRISVPSDVSLMTTGDVRDEIHVGCSGDCSVIVETHPKEPDRTGNKVKIITLSVRPCVPAEIAEG